MTDPLVALDGVRASVAGFEALHGVSLRVEPGEAVGLVGRNGAGKTTTFRATMGLAEVTQGSIRFRGEELTDIPADRIPGRGVGYQPEDRKLFTGMTVEENFRLPIWTVGDERGVEDEDSVVESVFEVFPELDDRRSALVENLSGGQAKMTAIGRALALEPDLLLLDEPLEGLAPVVVSNLKEHVRAINDRGITVLIAESNVTHIPDLVDRIYVMERGEIVASGDPDDLAGDEEIQKLMQGSGRE